MVFSLFYIFLVFIAFCHKILVEELLIVDVPLDFHIFILWIFIRSFKCMRKCC